MGSASVTESSGESLSTVTNTMWQRFTVEYAYPVSFTRDLFNPRNPLLRDTLAQPEPDKRHRCLVFLDEGVLDARPDLGERIAAYARAWPESLELLGKPVTLCGGENIKSDTQGIEQMQETIFEHRVDRHSYVIGVGGGALLDACGYAAATAHRGIRHLRVPTTVLSQNDSGVGVKNGINRFGQKNWMGTFAPPFAVLNDQDFIDALPERDRIAGMAEAVKVALIRDADFYAWLEQNSEALRAFRTDAMRTMIERCAALHLRQIGHGGDPFETGSARPLDFGHWSAHRLEQLTQYELRHGEAVAIGIALDTRYSVTCGLLDAGSENRVCALLESLGFVLWHPKLALLDSGGELEILRGLDDFQEHLGGELTITLLGGLGHGVEVHTIDRVQVTDAIDWLADRQAKNGYRQVRSAHRADLLTG